MLCHSFNFNQSLILYHVSRRSHIGPFSALLQFQLQPIPYPMSCFQAQSHWPILCSVTVPTLTSPLSYVIFPGTVTLAHSLLCRCSKFNQSYVIFPGTVTLAHSLLCHSSNFNQSLILCHISRHSHICPFSVLSQFQL